MIRISGALHRSNFLNARRCSLQCGQYHLSFSPSCSFRENMSRHASTSMPVTAVDSDVLWWGSQC